ncbi:hypothetical protein OF83DRAFT_1087955 [Amylostereum chailletii]|nr:hypothetical protein OF83DRAFT_1087955 [Amylostereum chailletii]
MSRWRRSRWRRARTATATRTRCRSRGSICIACIDSSNNTNSLDEERSVCVPDANNYPLSLPPGLEGAPMPHRGRTVSVERCSIDDADASACTYVTHTFDAEGDLPSSDVVAAE